MWRIFTTYDMHTPLSKTSKPFSCTLPPPPPTPQAQPTLPRDKLCWRASPLQVKGRLLTMQYVLSHLRPTRWNQPYISQKLLSLKFTLKLLITYQEFASKVREKEREGGREMESPHIQIVQLLTSSLTKKG